MSAQIPVVETFVSLQGEGPSAGEPALFLRLGNCNLNCTWCDTRHSWDWDAFDRAEEVENVDARDLSARVIRELPDTVHLLVLTGGEPLLNQNVVVPVLREIKEHRPDLRVEVETNGTIAPTPSLVELVHLFVVSPKLHNSGIAEKRRLRVPVLARFSESPSILKFVVAGPADVQEAADVARSVGFPGDRVWVMPETTTAADVGSLIAAVAPAAIRAGFKVSSRLHLLAWGDTRGT
ncbi:7-carboxy-7-deazaguanine synthase QueE [Microbacterium sp. ISL-103]|uniref:7-carboxy-7-deazaguanine synthase QueE n=1 Tax=Microbacterium sp. ISL-103 TaxID=2819156 RepID=UPI001BEAFB14|nr:7-carboxy-7-deazaguanine synthase QueE [Microbacterium sp. ISL-103]MBT2474877.1 7-carboxy-7-deazaguanine synthase QueE [Microbacterium sp. ISL-103]